MSAAQFFFDNAGWGYNPATQSPFVGRWLGAEAWARAEAWADENGAIYEWDVSDIDSSDWDTENPPHAQYDCVLKMPCDTCDKRYRCTDRCRGTHVKASLSGIDFGAGKGPCSYDPHDYRRVVEAELALEAMNAPPPPPSLVDVLTRLVAWADQMGGWEAPVWDEARAAIAKPEGRS